MDEKMMFDMLKRIIYEQNKMLLKEVAPIVKKDLSYLEDKYLRIEYYLPILEAKLKK